jgi:hypothetical protein
MMGVYESNSKFLQRSEQMYKKTDQSQKGY